MASPAGNRVNALILPFTLLSGTVVFFRLFTRFFILRNAGREDLCISLAMLFSLGLTVAISVQVQNGMGKHLIDLTPAEMINSQKAFWASIWIYYLALAVTKMSILFQYLRIFPTKRFRIVCLVMLAVVALYGVWGFFGSVFLCFPVRFFWDKAVPGGKCLNQFAVWFTNAAVNIVQDFVILLMPMPVLRSLDIPRRQKRVLMGIFALGGVVCIISVIRLQALVAISNSTDPTFDNPPAATLSAVETNVGIITACLPALRPLLSIMMPGCFPPTKASTHDEEQPKQLTSVATSRPATGTTTTADRGGYSRTLSGTTYPGQNNSEHGDAPRVSRVEPKFAGTGIRVFGPVKQVHIRSPSAATSLRLDHSMPAAPPRAAQNKTVTLSYISDWSLRARSLSDSSVGSKGGHVESPRTPLLVLKPLPLTPFPVVPV